MSEKLTQQQLARRLGESARTIRDLDLPRGEDGRYPWDAARDAWLAAKNAAAVKRVTPAEESEDSSRKRRLLELRGAKMEAELEVIRLKSQRSGPTVPAGSYRAALHRLVESVRVSLLAVESKWPPLIENLLTHRLLQEGGGVRDRCVLIAQHFIRPMAEDVLYVAKNTQDQLLHTLERAEENANVVRQFIAEFPEPEFRATAEELFDDGEVGEIARSLVATSAPSEFPLASTSQR
jgi:hypothetical protein